MDIQLPAILFQIVNFGVVAGGLTYLLYKPVIKILEERSRRVEEAQKAAEKTLAEHARIAETEKKAVEKAEAKASEILEKARANAKQLEKELMTQAKEKADKELEKAKQEWSARKQGLVADMQQQFTESVLATAELVIGESLDAKKHKKLLDEQLQKVAKAL